jgi:hypothetical protein
VSTMKIPDFGDVLRIGNNFSLLTGVEIPA